MFPLFKSLEVHDCGDSVKAYACNISDRKLFESEKLKTQFIQVKLDLDIYPEMSDTIIFCGSDVQKLPPIPALYMWIRGWGFGYIEKWIERDNDPLYCDCIAYIGQTQNLQERMMETPTALRQLGLSGEFGHRFLFNHFPVCVPNLFYNSLITGSDYDEVIVNQDMREDDFHYDYFTLVFKPWWGSIEDLKVFEKRMIRKYTPYGNIIDNPWCTKKPRQMLEQLGEMQNQSGVSSLCYQKSLESFLWNKFRRDVEARVNERRSLPLASEWFDSNQLTVFELGTLEKYLSLFQELNQLKQQGENNGSQLAAVGQFDFGFFDKS